MRKKFCIVDQMQKQVQHHGNGALKYRAKLSWHNSQRSSGYAGEKKVICGCGIRKWEESEVAFLQMLAMTSTTDSQCPIHIPSPFLCRLTMTSKWFAWVDRVWEWAGQKFKEWCPLGSDLKQMTDGSWWIKPPASSPQPYWSTQFSSVLSGNSLDNKPFIYFWLLFFSSYFSPCVSWEYLC